MLDRVYQQIELADIIIADMSEKNSNVFYEVGYAHAKQKLCIHITYKAEDIPFDLEQRQHIVYNNSVTYLRELHNSLASYPQLSWTTVDFITPFLVNLFIFFGIRLIILEKLK